MKKRRRTHRSAAFLAEHQGVEPWHRSPGLSHFESLNRLDEAGFVRLSLAVAGIFCASQKWHIIAIYRQKSTTFCEVPLEKAFFTQAVSGCISGVVVLDVRYYNSHFDSLAPTANCISQIAAWIEAAAKLAIELCSAAVAVPAHSRLLGLNAAFPESRGRCVFFCPQTGLKGKPPCPHSASIKTSTIPS